MKPIDYFNDLTYSLATARLLLQRAHPAGFVIEGICLYVSVIDGFLRLAIIYTRTQKSPDHTYKINKNMIRQDEKEKTYSEREIYDLAFKENIISEDLYRRLKEMYQFRNKVVHRFTISDITYKQIADVCSQFEYAYQEIFDIVAFLEHGEHGIRKASNEELKSFKKSSFKKIAG